MTNLENEKLVRYLVVEERPGRRFTAAEDTRWGGLITPDPEEVSPGPGRGARVVLFGSWLFGYVLLRTLELYQDRFPGALDLVGLVTDDPLNPDARIFAKKRVWRLVDSPHTVIDETAIISSALGRGVPVYTGEVKVDSFRRLLGQWRPDVILVCVFGQLIDARIIEVPPLGIYNFHPSDLAGHHGAGPAPCDDLAQSGAGATVWSVHQVDEGFDTGKVVGQSPPVNVLHEDGTLPGDPLVVYEKISEALGPVASLFVDEICRRYRRSERGAVDRVELEEPFPGELRARLLQPVRKGSPEGTLFVPEPSLLA